MSKSGRLALLRCAVLFIVALAGCAGGHEKAPDVSGIKPEMHTYRFDQDFSGIDTNHMEPGLRKLLEKYPDFANYYLDTIMTFGIGGNFADTSRGVKDSLRPYLTFRDFVNLQDTINKYYPSSKQPDAELADGFKYMKYYFPKYTIPKVIYVNMYLSKWPAFLLDSTTLCIGLDMFLGRQFPYYRSIGVQEYMDAHVQQSYLPVSAFNTIYKGLHPLETEDRSLLDLMIQRGKEQYFMHHILPHTPDSVLFGFTQRQLDWCAGNEALAFDYFIHQNLLYNKNLESIQPYIYDGPFAKGLEANTDPVKNTPGNIGTWLGYRIVCSYMARHPAATLPQLLGEQADAAKFLETAQYHPK